MPASCIRTLGILALLAAVLGTWPSSAAAYVSEPVYAVEAGGHGSDCGTHGSGAAPCCGLACVPALALPAPPTLQPRFRRAAPTPGPIAPRASLPPEVMPPPPKAGNDAGYRHTDKSRPVRRIAP